MARKRKKEEGRTEKGKKMRSMMGKIVLVLAVLAACVFPVIFVSSPISYVPLISFVLLLIISFVYLQILKRSLKFSEDSLLPSCERGSDIEFVVEFENESPLVFTRLEATFYISDLFGEVDTSIPATMPLMPHEKRDFSFEANFEHLGSYQAGVEKVVIYDLLGLFSHTIVNENKHVVRVLPKLFDIERIDFDDVTAHESKASPQPIVTDDMDYAGVRDYAPGDSLKSIHWKLSSRNPEGQYFTRLFEVFSNPGINIIIDTKAPQYNHEQLMEIFDGVVESALSINQYAREKGLDADIVYTSKYGESARMVISGFDDSDELVDSIARIEVGDTDQGAEVLRKEGGSIHSQSNIAYCTSQLDERVISTLINIKMHRRSPLLYLCIPRGLSREEERELLAPAKRLDASRIPYAIVRPDRDVKGVGA